VHATLINVNRRGEERGRGGRGGGREEGRVEEGRSTKSYRLSLTFTSPTPTFVNQ